MKFENNADKEAAVKATVRHALAERRTRGRTAPHVMVIDATERGYELDPAAIDMVDPDTFALQFIVTRCFDSFDDFKAQALRQNDRICIEHVRAAIAKSPRGDGHLPDDRRQRRVHGRARGQGQAMRKASQSRPTLHVRRGAGRRQDRRVVGLIFKGSLVWHKPRGFQPWNMPQMNAEFVTYAQKVPRRRCWERWTRTALWRTASRPRAAHSQAGSFLRGNCAGDKETHRRRRGWLAARTRVADERRSGNGGRLQLP